MSNGFEFYQGNASESTTPKITVRKGGQLVLTSGAVEMLGDDISHVQLAYNPKKGIVGIRGADEDAQGHYRLRSQNAYSEGIRPPVPRESDHPFQGNATTHSNLKPTTWSPSVGRVVGLDRNHWSLCSGMP